MFKRVTHVIAYARVFFAFFRWKVREKFNSRVLNSIGGKNYKINLRKSARFYNLAHQTL
ncbi:hypothetical protein SAMN04488168_1464 [Bacillus sp. 491mf]|nr:hypothetical protein SAMN04488168_1464 [Bacillus sp. 491mf]